MSGYVIAQCDKNKIKEFYEPYNEYLRQLIASDLEVLQSVISMQRSSANHKKAFFDTFWNQW